MNKQAQLTPICLVFAYFLNSENVNKLPVCDIRVLDKANLYQGFYTGSALSAISD